jgi:hypothetical protein
VVPRSEVRIMFLKTLLYTTTNWKPTHILRSSMEPYSTRFGIPYQRRGLDTWMNAWSYYLIKTKYQIIKRNQRDNKMEVYSNISNIPYQKSTRQQQFSIKILKVHNSPNPISQTKILKFIKWWNKLTNIIHMRET